MDGWMDGCLDRRSLPKIRDQGDVVGCLIMYERENEEEHADWVNCWGWGFRDLGSWSCKEELMYKTARTGGEIRDEGGVSGETKVLIFFGLDQRLGIRKPIPTYLPRPRPWSLDPPYDRHTYRTYLL